MYRNYRRYKKWLIRFTNTLFSFKKGYQFGNPFYLLSISIFDLSKFYLIFFKIFFQNNSIIRFSCRIFSNSRLSMFRKKVELLLIKKVIVTKKIFYEKLWDLKSGIYFYIRNANPIPESVPSKKTFPASYQKTIF